MMNSCFQLTERPDGILLLTLDVPGERVNTLNASLIPEFSALLQSLQQGPAPAGLIISSAKADNFIAGADIRMLEACPDAAAAEALARQGQQLFEQLAQLPFPVVAAIHGACLGGGLELALACDYRICSDDEQTRLGFPEVQLGLLPGSGGTQRLPRLIGLPAALDLLLSGRRLRPGQARRWGLVSAVVPQAILLEVAAQQLAGGKVRSPRLSGLQALLLRAPLRGWILGRAGRQVAARTRGNYPAPAAILDVLEIGLARGAAAGLAEEARQFGLLQASPQSAALRGLFLAGNALKKEIRYQGAEPLALNHIGVLGAGQMGAGIAMVSVNPGGMSVRLKDLSAEGLNRALRHCHAQLAKRRDRRQLSPEAMRAQLALFSASQDYSGFRRLELVIEAVFEDLSLKQQLLQEVEQLGGPGCIFASNTSSLPIAQIAAQAAHPERVVGLHYFNPVEKMPLVEVIPHAGTDATVVATVLALARAQGKTPVVVQDVSGFYVNRILAPYLNEAARILLEGETVEIIDAALQDYGFPMGPLALLDEIGLDVAAGIGPILALHHGERFRTPELLQQLLSDGRKGRKSGRGFYRYDAGKGRREVDGYVYDRLKVIPVKRMERSVIAERCVLLMLNEAARTLAEGVIASARDGDLAAVYGLGFPPFLGGPFHAMQQRGLANLVAALRQHAEQYGERFAPCEALLERLEGGADYYPAGE